MVRSEHTGELERWTWCLRVERSATEADLEQNHHLEEVGETIWYAAIGISHCPFCGARLADGAERAAVPEAEFLLVAGGGWNGDGPR